MNTIRRTGKSTRLIDQYIQQLFELGTITVHDHHESEVSHLLLKEKILKRLSFEHPFIEIKKHDKLYPFQVSLKRMVHPIIEP